MRSREERREEARSAAYDAYYEVWRSGRDPDKLDMERAQEMAYNDDLTGDEIASRHINVENARRSSVTETED